jgi:glucose-1-phosphate thymidylyltransferase
MGRMKGLILAGGKATRLRPLTYVTNKHLLPIYNKPLIYYPIEAMAKAGVKDVIITTNPEHVGSFVNLLRTGQDWGLRITYEVQENPKGGLAEPIQLIEPFAKGEQLLMILGDNIFTHDLGPAVKEFQAKGERAGAKIFGKEVEHAEQYGVVEMQDGKVLGIEEKPEHPKSNLAQTGVYMYDERVFDLARNQQPSDRGELEITDLNNVYVQEGSLECEVMDGYWIDAGTSYDELLAANNKVAELVKSGELEG